MATHITDRQGLHKPLPLVGGAQREEIREIGVGILRQRFWKARPYLILAIATAAIAIAIAI
jgi:hypothetical protein